MYTKLPPATSLIQRASAFIAYLLRLQEHNERIIASAPLLALPAPKGVTASTWERERHPCPVCGEEMTKETFSTRYFCLGCDELVAEEARKQLSKARMPIFKTGELVRSYHHAQAGTYARDIRNAWRDEAVKQVLSTLQTNKNIQNTPEAKEIGKQRTPTGPLPARDIERANTTRNPATPTPETRETLFADVPDVPHEEDDEEATEKRRTVRKTTDTVEIPAMNAEVILEALRDGKLSEQNTGENERLPARISNWML